MKEKEVLFFSLFLGRNVNSKDRYTLLMYKNGKT